MATSAAPPRRSERTADKIDGPNLDPGTRVRLVSGPTDRPPWYSSTPSGDDVARQAVEKRLRSKNFSEKASGTETFRCCYCGGYYSPGDLEIEHIHPYSEIGRQASSQTELEIIANDTANLSYACGTKAKGCNQSKSDKLLFNYLKNDPAKYQKFLEENDAKWMDPALSGAMAYQAPYKRKAGCDADKPSQDDAAYQAQLAKRMKTHGADLRPRAVIGQEQSYYDLDGRVIGPRAAVEECCERAGKALSPPKTQDEVLKEVLSTSSSSVGKHSADLITSKPGYIQKICWQTRKQV